MPHYLRMLTYVLQPDTEWGPAKNENRYGRYKPKIDQSTAAYQSDVNDGNDNFALDLESSARI
jgi:hypothetical protein